MEKNEAKQLYDLRVSSIRSAIAFKKPLKVPVVSNTFNWQFIDAGMKVGEAVRDYDMIEKAARRFVEKYKVDQHSAGLRNPFKLTDTLGARDTYLSSTSDDNLNAVMEEAIEAEDYDEVIKGNLNKVLWERALPKLYPAVKDFTAEQFAEAAKSYGEYGQAAGKSVTMLKDEYGITGINSKTWLTPFFEDLFRFYRGIKALSIDVRRVPEKLEEASDVMTKAQVDYALSAIGASEDGPEYPFTSECYSPLLGHTILNRKNFERFYMKYFAPVFSLCEEKGKAFAFFSEGDMGRILDYMDNYKKGTTAVMIETEDVFELRKQFANVCFYGGLEINKMAFGTKEECIDMTKRLIDDLGGEGGLILEPSKMVSYKNDMNPDNLQAVCDFVWEYR